MEPVSGRATSTSRSTFSWRILVKLQAELDPFILRAVGKPVPELSFALMRPMARLKFYLAILLGIVGLAPVGAQDEVVLPGLPDTEIVFSQNAEIYRLDLDDSLSGKIRRTLLAKDFAGAYIRRRPGHPGQFAYAKRDGFVVMDRCGARVLEVTRPGTGSGFHYDFVWSHSGRYIAYGVYSGVFNGSPDTGVNRLDVDTGETVRLVQPTGFTYEHSPAYSPDDRLLSYVHHEFEVQNWFGLIGSNGGETRIWLRLPDSFRDEHQFFTWIDHTRVLGFNARQGAFVLVNTAGEGSYETFPVEGSSAQLELSPLRTRFALRTPQRTPTQVTYGDVGEWNDRVDAPFGQVVENVTWIDEDYLLVYLRNRIELIDVNGNRSHTVTETRITNGYGVEALISDQ